MKKFSFLNTEVEYLGRTITNGEVRPSKSKIAALINSPEPKNVRQVRQFLGLAGYFRKYVENYAFKTTCISRLTKKDFEFKWGEEQKRARADIIKCLTSEPVLAIFNPTLLTEVHTDASSQGYGVVLLQIHRDGSKSVVAYYSQVTTGLEVRYHSYELETLAVVRALRHFRHYRIGIEFKVVSDCNALKATQNKKELLPRVARWWVYLKDFTFTIVYRKGVLMPHADYLSNPIRIVNSIDKPRNWAQIAQSGHCLTCISNKRVPRAPLQPITSWTKPDVAFHTLHMDMLGPLQESNGYKHVMVVVDAFSKYCLLYLNITRQKTTQASPLNLLVGTEGTTPAIQALVRDVTVDCSSSVRQSLRELDRQRTAERLKQNQRRQDEYVNKRQHPTRAFQVEKSISSGAGTEDIYTPSLWYYQYFTFLHAKQNPAVQGVDNYDDCDSGSERIVNHQEEDTQSLDNISVFLRSPKLKQQTVLQLLKKSASYDDGGERHIAITQSLVYMIIKDNIPLSCVEKEGLQQFVEN
ncbi:unnamed protein product [Pieris macdunnoughi]|uniref:RNA-directed DNA polymerase n=1 Tax=Pieris macdunnoughi TaxID=345717 RepID=A0A821ULI8_9NEOP|nr:unnamed protein product [Pieris macdunnoughi]